MALVYLRHRDRITNADYRGLHRVDPIAAGNELRGLVEANLIEQQGVGRWTYYTLEVPDGVSTPAGREMPDPETDEGKILAYVQRTGAINNAQCRELLAVDAARAYYLIRKLCRSGFLGPIGERKSRRYVPKQE